MSGRVRKLNRNVRDMAFDRFRKMYGDGHRVMVTASGGKDSTVCVEMARMAARVEGCLPLEVVFQDDEIGLPTTFEYLERLAVDSEIKFYWMLTYHPVHNLCSREFPYFWTFDPLLSPDQWIREPPEYAIGLDTQDIDNMIMPGRFPPQHGKDLINVQGLRTEESQGRKLALLSAGGYLTKIRPLTAARSAYPIYDWMLSDVWTFIKQTGCDYNKAYDIMYRLNVKKGLQRIGPITMNLGSVQTLIWAHRVWPEWSERVFARCPGTRNVARYGLSAVKPHRKPGDTWKETYQRLCINEAPAWIAERAIMFREETIKRYEAYAGVGAHIPEVKAPPTPNLRLASWMKMTMTIYDGDPYGMKIGLNHVVEPEFFRPGSGKWRNSQRLRELRKVPVLEAA